MNSNPVIDVIIPALNEAASIGKVLDEVDRNLIRSIVVCDNGSMDGTAQIAAQHGAEVVSEMRRGYGFACLKAIEHIKAKPTQPDIVVFMDGDYSDFPNEMLLLTEPILKQNADLVIGSRVLGAREKKSLTPQQVFGNKIATLMIRLFYGASFTDLGPFRAIRWEKLLELNMKDETYGWTVEMQAKAARRKLRLAEVPVSYRKRIGQSKVSGTVRGSILAGYKIIYTILRYSWA